MDRSNAELVSRGTQDIERSRLREGVNPTPENFFYYLISKLNSLVLYLSWI